LWRFCLFRVVEPFPDHFSATDACVSTKPLSGSADVRPRETKEDTRPRWRFARNRPNLLGRLNAFEPCPAISPFRINALTGEGGRRSVLDLQLPRRGDLRIAVNPSRAVDPFGCLPRPSEVARRLNGASDVDYPAGRFHERRSYPFQRESATSGPWAAGSGISPVMSLLRTVLRRRETRSVFTLVYATRGPATVNHSAKELEDLKDRYLSERRRSCTSSAAKAQARQPRPVQRAHRGGGERGELLPPCRRPATCLRRCFRNERGRSSAGPRTENDAGRARHFLVELASNRRHVHVQLFRHARAIVRPPRVDTGERRHLHRLASTESRPGSHGAYRR